MLQMRSGIFLLLSSLVNTALAVSFGSFNGRVIVVIHQTVGVAVPVALFDKFSKYIQKGFMVPIILVDGISCITARSKRGNVMYCSGIFNA